MLAAGAGRRLVPADANVIQQHVAFGDLVIPRAYVDVRHRRISPSSLSRENMHRSDWLSALLPYCPSSLERLVDACDLCGAVLGWTDTLGIGTCESCGEPIGCSAEAGLPQHMVQDYRLFAGLVSLDAGVRAATIGALPDGIASLEPGEIVRLAVRCGLDCTQGAGPRAWQKRMQRLPAVEVVRIVTRGAELVRTWPEGIRTWAMQAASDSIDDAGRYADVRRRLKRIAQGDTFFRPLDELMTAAFPALHASIGHSFAGDDRYYLGHETDRKLGIAHHRTVMLRDQGLLPFKKVPGGAARTRGRYCAASVDDLARRIRSSVPITACQPALGLPIYAVEQLLCMSLLEADDHPAMATLFDGVRVKQEGIDLLIGRLAAMASKGRRPRNLAPVTIEMRRFGGRPKPWASVYSAMLSGAIRFWTSGGAVAPDLMVTSGSIDYLEGQVFLESNHTHFPFTIDLHTGDAAEVLNLNTPGVEALRAAGVVSGTRQAKSFRSPKDEIYALASEYVSTAELMRRGRTSAERVNVQLSARGFARRHGLWLRHEVMDVIPVR